MPNRADVLIELGLAPTWRLRGRGRAGELTPASDAPSVAGTAPRAAVAASNAERSAGCAASDARASDRNSGRAAIDAATTADSAVHPAGARDDREARVARIATLEWRDFAADVDACVACGLAGSRRKSVPGVGDRAAEWLFVGEAPGSEEDARGEPFVGQAGKLLDSMLAALGLRRGENVYIANVLKCRPPNNRTPEPREVECCRPYLDRQIALIRPRLVVALGRSAAATLLETDATIASLRGRVHGYRGVPLVVTYHPAYLLRNLPDKAKAWEDLLFARRTLQAAKAPGDPAGGGSLPL